MLSRNIHSHAYKKLLEQQAQEDEDTKARLADLRKKQIRDDIRRKREEEEARRREQQAKERRAEEARQAKIQSESKSKKEVERPVTTDSASTIKSKPERQTKAPVTKKDVSQPSKVLSSKYSDLLSTAPTKLDTKMNRVKITPDIPTRQTIGKFAPSPLTAKKVELQKSLSADRLPTKSQSSSSEPRRSMTPKLAKADTPERRASPALKQVPVTAPRMKNMGATTIPSPQKKERDVRPQDARIERGNGKPRSDAVKRQAKRPREEAVTESIWDILNPGKRKASYLARDIDSDDEDSGMEADIDSIRREEARAARAARLEDEKEAQLLKEAEERKRRRRQA